MDSDPYTDTDSNDPDEWVIGPDEWVIGNGGNETWTRYRDGSEYLYVYNPGTGQHGFLGRDDIVVDEHDFYSQRGN